jgi:hypothetical protein
MRQLIPEMIYLLTRMGNVDKALTLIVEKMENVNLAIDYVAKQNDPALWKHLISYSTERPSMSYHSYIPYSHYFTSVWNRNSGEPCFNSMPINCITRNTFSPWS